MRGRHPAICYDAATPLSIAIRFIPSIQNQGLGADSVSLSCLTAVSNSTHPASVNHNSTAKNSTLPASLQSFASSVNLPKKVNLPPTASKTAIDAVNAANAAALKTATNATAKTADVTVKTANASVQAIKPSPLLTGFQHMQGKDLPTQSNPSKNATAPPAPARNSSSAKSSAPIHIPNNLPPSIKEVLMISQGLRPTNSTTARNTTTTTAAKDVSATSTSTSTSTKTSASASTSTSTSLPSLVETVSAAALKSAKNAAKDAEKAAKTAEKAAEKTVEKATALPTAVKNTSVLAAPLKNVTLPAGLGTVSVKDAAPAKATEKAAVPEKTEAPKKTEKADKPRAVYTVLLMVTPPDELPRRR